MPTQSQIYKIFGWIFAIACGVMSLGVPKALAGLTPISVAIVPPVQFPPDDFTVAGSRVSAIWGKHRSVYGLDLGVIGNMSTQNFGGIGVAGIFNSTHNQATIIALQAAGGANINTGKTRVIGVQLAGLFNSNSAETTVIGFQLAGVANVSPFTTVGGVQIGLYNQAREVYGFQIGLINQTEILHGLQIGLINFNKRGLFSVAPILNFGF